MKTKSYILCLVVAICFISTSTRCTLSDLKFTGELYQSNIIDSFDIAIPVPSGICSDGLSFWIPNHSASAGNREIYKIDIRTHKIISIIPSPYAWTTGMAWVNGNLWALDGYPEHHFSIIKLSPTTGEIITYHPAEYSCYWSGIAWDGSYLYYGTNTCWVPESRERSMIFKVDTSHGNILDSIPPPSGNINGLVFYRSCFWYCDDDTRKIYKMTTHGDIIKSFPSPGILPSGLAIAQGYLWNVDTWNQRVYQIEIGLAPSIPRNLIAEGSDKEVQLTWTRNKDADLFRYRLYRDTSDNWLKASLLDSIGSNETSYQDHQVINGHTYNYWLTTVDSEGFESHESKSAMAIPLDKISPPSLASITAQPDYGKVILNWEASNAPDLSYYKIYRGISDNVSKSKVIGITQKPHTIYIDSVFTNSILMYYWVTAVDSSENESAFSSVIGAKPIFPLTFTLKQNYPNPFNSSTVIPFDVPLQVDGTLKIYNTIGQLIKTFDLRNETIGYKQVIWDGRNELGYIVNSGIYVYKLQIGTWSMSRKAVYVR